MGWSAIMRQLDPAIGAGFFVAGWGGVMMQIATDVLTPALLFVNFIAGILGIWLVYLRIDVAREERRQLKNKGEDEK